jgi:holliday junction DNA helicase RuvA
MIGQLRGRLAHKQPPQLLLDVQGVGYEVEAPMSTFYVLPALGAEVTLYTHLVVRDDAHLLYGFASPTERALFRSLIRVNGVGARLAVTILSGISADDFVRSVQLGDTASLVRLPGVGKKTAERLLVEMRDRLHDWEGGAPVSASSALSVPGPQRAEDDAIAALVALGYKPQEASRLVQQVEGEGLASEEIIRSALQSAARAAQR